MLVTRKIFKCIIVHDETGDKRIATGNTPVMVMQPDDIIDDKLDEAKHFPVRTLGQVNFAFLKQRIFSFIFDAVLWAGTLLQAIRTATAVMILGQGWPAYIPLAILASLTLLYTPRVLHPLVHDRSGHWIDLVTGESNLNGGCTII